MKHLILTLILLLSLYSCEDVETVSIFTKITIQPKEEEPVLTRLVNPDAKQLVDDKTIYDFLNTIIATDALNLKVCNTLIGQNHMPLFTDKRGAMYILRSAKILTIQDREYIYKQSLYSTQFKIDKTKLRLEKNVIIPDTCDVYGANKDYWRNIRKQFGSFCVLSMPLFSKDKKAVIIEYSYCCGILCGYGGYYVFRKENGTWTFVTTLEGWVS